jgi:hypothetical protein
LKLETGKTGQIARERTSISAFHDATRAILFGGSSAIPAAAIKINVERLKNPSRLFRLAPNSDQAVEPWQ